MARANEPGGADAADRGGRPRGRRPLIPAHAALAAGVAAGIVTGLVLAALGMTTAADAVWGLCVAVVVVPLSLDVLRTLRRGELGVDAIALLAMIGAVALGEYLVGAVVAMMLAGGNALERAAAKRASRELTRLVSRAPRTARRLTDGHLEEVPVEEIAVGDRLVVRTGEIVPVDGSVQDELAVLDESALTGEPLPVERMAGEAIRSGVANAGPPFEMGATRPAADSAYAAIVRLVRDAEAARAPFLRMADRYAGVLLPVTLAVAAVAWIGSGDPVRALAVLVIATPCPLILAAPVALVSGMSRVARMGIILKGSVVVERLGRARTILLDKTGTITTGTPEVRAIHPLDGVSEEELLRLAASVEQLSAHVVATALVRAAADRDLPLSVPTAGVEAPGQGIRGTVEGRAVAAGSPAFLAEHGLDGSASALVTPTREGEALVVVAIDGRMAGTIVLGDRLRDDAPELVRHLRAGGVAYIGLVTGDRKGVAEDLGRRLGVDRVYSEQSPQDKVDVVTSVRSRPDARSVVMIGDGINDAPALAAADVGVALAAAGATISSEVADAVVLVDRVDRVGAAIEACRRALAIARQSILVGLGLSFAGMALAAVGLLSPIAGALAQEAIDVAVILNALRALRG
jgi:heavy metal translocating P-type ATPase